MNFKLIYFVDLILLPALLWLAGLIWFATCIPYHPASDDRNADAIVVLTGGALRLEHGFELLANRRAPRMFISGVEDNVSLNSLLRNKELHDFSGKISEASVTLGHKARSTLGNANEIAEWIKENHVQSVRLVTGNYHIPRSISEIRKAAPGLVILPDPVFPSHSGGRNWWQSESGIRLVISEYNKYLGSLVLH